MSRMAALGSPAMLSMRNASMLSVGEPATPPQYGSTPQRAGPMSRTPDYLGRTPDLSPQHSASRFPGNRLSGMGASANYVEGSTPSKGEQSSFFNY